MLLIGNMQIILRIFFKKKIKSPFWVCFNGRKKIVRDTLSHSKKSRSYLFNMTEAPNRLKSGASM